jgi:penicillin-binding protein 1A
MATSAPKPRRRWTGRLFRLGLVGAVALAGLSVVAGGVAGGLYYEHVVRSPGTHLDRAQIEAIIADESPVMYRDGVTRIGVFFDDEHRQYVSWEEIPRSYAVALVAAEDGTFWTHPGVSAKHLVRAMWDNVQAGDVVAGGSTLTQQTAKNLYYRPDRSLRSKWTELVNAMRLEAHYDKTEILTFYANQFHVSGNGRGLGIAARYFFDKDVSELTTVEAAFLAGLVKAPAYYDPFVGDVERRERATERAHDRTRYVLQRIVDEDVERLAGPLPTRGDPASELAYAARITETRLLKDEAERLLRDGFTLPFRRGTFRYDSSAVLDEVARRLGEAPFDAVLANAGIDDPATAGLVVVTTLDPQIQQEAVYSLWHHLTEVGAWMEGPEASAFVRTDGSVPRFAPDHAPRRHEFRLGRLEERTGNHFVADLGGARCTVDRDAWVRAAAASHRGRVQDKSARLSTAQVDAFLSEFDVGDVVWLSVRDVTSAGAVCDLELRPTLQGAAVVVEDGEIRAMVGGNDNRNFNRASALRQLGSTWKPIIYHAAMNLGWLPTDPVDNGRNVFPFSTTFYYPKPDHAPVETVSLGWAGVHSENLASVWLLFHLTDRLDHDGVVALATSLGLARKDGESAAEYRDRMQREGILPTPRRVEEAVYLRARQELVANRASWHHPEDLLAVQSMPYGWGYSAERGRVAGESSANRAWKGRALDNSWLAFEPWLDRCGIQYDTLARAWERGGAPDPRSVGDLSVKVGTAIEVACGEVPDGFVSVATLGDVARPAPAGPGRVRPDRRPPGRDVPGRPAEPEPEAPAIARAPLAPRGAVWIDGRMHLATAEALEQTIRRRELATGAPTGDALYDPEVLYWHQDFRTLLAMRYVAAMAREYGVRTDIREVLSMPLGASEITLEEATLTYEGLISGQAWRFPGESTRSDGSIAAVDAPAASSLLIAEIRDVDGNVLYRAKPVAERVTTPQIGAMTSDVMRNVVRYGTGTSAAEVLVEGDSKVPLGGKTGTTNDFKNAAFLGYVPRPSRDGYDPTAGYTVGVYVGYDDNHPMVAGRIKLAGASGALPAWIGIARGIDEAGLLGAPRGPSDAGWWSVAVPDGLVRHPADASNGLVSGGAPYNVDQVAPVSILAPPITPLPPPPPEVGPVASRRWPVRVAPGTDGAPLGGAADRPGLWDRRRRVERLPR